MLDALLAYLHIVERQLSCTLRRSPSETSLRLSGLRADPEQDELTSPQAVHLAEVRLPIFLALGMGLGFSVTTALPSFTARLPKPPAGSPYSMLRRAICIRRKAHVCGVK